MTGTAEPPDVRGVLLAARGAVAEGRALQAIDELSRFEQRHPDPRLERRIVELRHLAFVELDRTAGRPSWPVQMTDPFPGEDGLPEITAGHLSGDVIGGAIVNHGCLRVNGLLTEATVLRLRNSVDRSFEAREQLAKGESLEAVAPWLVPFEPGRAKADGFGQQGFVRVVDVPRLLCDLVEVFDDAGVSAAVTEYLQERPAMIANKWVLRRTPTGKSGTDFHQDGTFLGDGIRTVDCWISLSHCGPGTGRPGIDLVPRRFDSILVDDDSTFPWSLTEAAVRAAALGSPILGPVFEPGDALFFDEHLPHRTSVGLDLTTRYAIESWFVAPSSYPAKHVPVVL